MALSFFFGSSVEARHFLEGMGGCCSSIFLPPNLPLFSFRKILFFFLAPPPRSGIRSSGQYCDPGFSHIFSSLSLFHSPYLISRDNACVKREERERIICLCTVMFKVLFTRGVVKKWVFFLHKSLKKNSGMEIQIRCGNQSVV